jgi:hypothetical protein
MRAFRAVMAILLFICLLPLMGMAVAEFIAQVNGCNLDLTGAHPCIVGGQDRGHDLLTLAMASGYLLFVTMPGVAGIVVLWVLVEVIAFVRRRAA